MVPRRISIVIIYHAIRVRLGLDVISTPRERPADTDGDDSQTVATDGGEDVEHYPDGFTSGDHGVPPNPPRQEPDPGDPSNWCYECGDRANAWCVCGMPLSHRHAET